jgi:hypothetical protein
MLRLTFMLSEAGADLRRLGGLKIHGYSAGPPLHFSEERIKKKGEEEKRRE